MQAKAKQIKIINQAHYHYHDIISLTNFKFWKIDRKQALIKRIDDYECICSIIAPLHWIGSFASEYTQERGGKKYLIFDNSFSENKDLLKKYTEFWDVVKHRIKLINREKEADYMKINGCDDLMMTCH